MQNFFVYSHFCITSCAGYSLIDAIEFVVYEKMMSSVFIAVIFAIPDFPLRRRRERGAAICTTALWHSLHAAWFRL